MNKTESKLDCKPLEVPEFVTSGGDDFHRSNSFYGDQGCLGVGRCLLWVWIVTLVVVVVCTALSIVSMAANTKLVLQHDIIKQFQQHESKPFFELHGIKTKPTTRKND